jgi:hypothetical protein
MRCGRSTCENCPSIDVRRWSRQNKLWPTTGFSESWTFCGEPVGSIAVTNEPNTTVVSFAYWDDETNDWKTVSQTIRVVWTRCAFGGGRPWLRCPVPTCGRRVAIIYVAQTPLFACRKCHNLTYASQLELERGRLIHRARTIRMKLGGGPNLFDQFPARPKGMHNRTYLRQRAAYEVAAKRCGAV